MISLGILRSILFALIGHEPCVSMKYSVSNNCFFLFLGSPWLYWEWVCSEMMISLNIVSTLEKNYCPHSTLRSPTSSCSLSRDADFLWRSLSPSYLEKNFSNMSLEIRSLKRLMITWNETVLTSFINSFDLLKGLSFCIILCINIARNCALLSELISWFNTYAKASFWALFKSSLL